MTGLSYRERAAAGVPEGLLVLHHGRGSDEHDLLSLADFLDPQRRLHVVTPRAPLRLSGLPGFHWYVVERVGYPEPATFAAGYSQLGEFHDELWQRTGVGPERTVLGGFSQGTVMAHALGLASDRPLPAGILAFSGFVPEVASWSPDLASRAGLAVFMAHGRADNVIDVSFGRQAEALLRDGGLAVEYHETAGGHQIEPAVAAAAAKWLEHLPA